MRLHVYRCSKLWQVSVHNYNSHCFTKNRVVEDSVVGDLVLLYVAHDPAETSEMESIQLVLLLGMLSKSHCPIIYLQEN